MLSVQGEIGSAQSEHPVLSLPRTHNLESDRKSGGGESTRHRKSRKPSDAERIGRKNHVIEMIDFSLANMTRQRGIQPKRWHTRRGAHDEIVTLEQSTYPMPIRRALALGPLPRRDTARGELWP